MRGLKKSVRREFEARRYEPISNLVYLPPGRIERLSIDHDAQLVRDLGDEVEFQTLMWFDGLDSIKAFMGGDYAVSHVPPAAQAALKRFDERAAHFEVIDRREQ